MEQLSMDHLLNNCEQNMKKYQIQEREQQMKSRFQHDFKFLRHMLDLHNEIVELRNHIGMD